MHFKSIQSIGTIKLIILLVVTLISNSNFAQNDVSSTKVGNFTFEEEIIDYGTIQQNDNGLRTFKFTNSGDAPIVISKIKTTCGCTVPYYSKKPIPPGESSMINIKYATNRVGRFSKAITVISNADISQKRLQIKGNVISKKTVSLNQ